MTLPFVRDHEDDFPAFPTLRPGRKDDQRLTSRTGATMIPRAVTLVITAVGHG